MSYSAQASRYGVGMYFFFFLFKRMGYLRYGKSWILVKLKEGL